MEIKVGQVWKRKRDGLKIEILNRRGEAWSTRKTEGTKQKTHHTTTFDLLRHWELNGN